MLDFFSRFDDRIIPEPNSGCFLWLGAWTTAGYGHGRRGGQHFYAHRAAYESAHGLGSARGLIVRHSCDNPPCCNPAHLLGGDQLDNVRDCISRGRKAVSRGEGSSQAKLTARDVLEIRRMALAGSHINEIAALFPVFRNAITAAVSGETWSHLGPGVSFLREPKKIPPVVRGEDGHTAILSNEQAAEILSRSRAGARGVDLASEFGVSKSTISSIRKGRSWAHLGGV